MAEQREIRDFESVKKTRSSHLAQLTQTYNDLEKKTMSYDNLEYVERSYVKLCDQFEQFRETYKLCLDLCEDQEIDKILDSKNEFNIVKGIIYSNNIRK